MTIQKDAYKWQTVRVANDGKIEIESYVVQSFFESDSLQNLLMEIFKVGGSREAFNFQLFYNEIRCTSKINKLKS